ncbi:dienelactone hydrolase family protein [Phormidium sp. CLA17]|uniref:dienelactone hydrolase family protein n=1 Tax=Leptolyngbya sp. Cla-17 TaxID=2803751 RepID=UPI0014930CC5|nr:dienelactone hydrolase family protein [Leptolyngbya sp. Cla-17]MBM0742898.1 dienelactone hydrolase family protein [Leptolyngbya sp. Cla-17]
MTAQNVVISVIAGSFSGYLATPDSPTGAGILLIQEIFGVNSVMRQIADSYAEAGYFALVPDLFWRLEPNIELDPQYEDQLAKAFDLYQRFDVDKGMEDLQASLNFLRHYPGCNGKVGSIGFCLGGKLAYLMATRTDADCNVSYYGVAIESSLAEATTIQRPLILHLAENDEFSSTEAQATIQQTLKENSLITIYSYAGVSHAFGRVDSAAYRAEAAELASDRTLAFLQQHLS